MKALIGLALMLAALFGIALILFLFLIFPISTLVNVANNKALNRGKKGTWIFVIFLTWTCGACLYQLMYRTSKINTVASVLGLAFLVGSLLAVGLGHPTLQKLELQKLTSLRASCVSATEHLPTEQRQIMLSSLDRLKSNIEQSSWYDFSRFSKSAQLVKLLQGHLSDGVITQEEYVDWAGQVRSFNILDANQLEEFARNHKVIEGSKQ